MPPFGMPATRIVTLINVVKKSFGRCFRCWACHGGIALILKLGFVSLPAPGAVDSVHGSVSRLLDPGIRANAFLIDHAAFFKPVDGEGFIELVWLVLGDCVCIAPAGRGRGFEAAVTPAAIQIELVDAGLTVNGLPSKIISMTPPQ